MYDTSKITTIQEVFDYWKECLKNKQTAWDSQAAWEMTDIVRSPSYDELIDESPALSNIWDHVSQLEISSSTHNRKEYAYRWYHWNAVKKLMVTLEKQCLDNRGNK